MVLNYLLTEINYALYGGLTHNFTAKPNFLFSVLDSICVHISRVIKLESTLIELQLNGSCSTVKEFLQFDIQHQKNLSITLERPQTYTSLLVNYVH